MHEPKEMMIFPVRLESAGIPYMATGSIAGVIYSEPRFTYDIGLVVRLQEKDIARLCEVFGPDEFYLPPLEVIRNEAQRDSQGHFNIIDFKGGVKADIYPLGADTLNHWAFTQRRQYNYHGIILWVAPVEYVIIRKLQFYQEGKSEKHLRDIKRMLKISGEEIDHHVLQEKLAEYHLTTLWRELLG
ncbi:MAG: hypothetical protein AMJ79_04060 [Phycisphaerae bacterium SM23_30]|nr:MAG: hypothetical protein AMJ79_04060 [Phycisphaerae bacterium SM23_30]